MRILLALCLLLWSFPFTATAETLSFYTHFIRPYAYAENGKIDGFAVALVREMKTMVGHPEAFKMVPFSRGLQSVQANPRRALFIMARRPERENTVKWVGPLIKSAVYFFQRAGDETVLRTLQDVKQLDAVGVGRGNADDYYLRQRGFTNLHPSNDHMLSLQMLMLGRIQTTPMDELVMPAMAKQAGIPVESIMRSDVRLYDSILYLGFSLDTSDETVAKWQKALDTLKSTGRYKEILRQYIPKLCPIASSVQK